MTRIFISLLLGATSLVAGGFYVEFGNPAANSDPKARDAVVVVRAVGCHEPENATFTGRAEGVIDGKRQSIELTMIPLAQRGVFAVKQQWPREGSWILTFAGSLNGNYLAGATLPVSGKGIDRLAAKVYHRKLTEDDIQMALK